MSLFPDPDLERANAQPRNVQDVVPPTERNQDPEVTEAMHELSGDVARPLTEEERRAAESAAPAGERVYAPASARVPVDPVPGHREFINRTDMHTPEREATSQTTIGSPEPSFARVPRPNTGTTGASVSTGRFGTHDDAAWNSRVTRDAPPWWLGWVGLGVGVGAGGFLFVRWQRERNRPINRLRRQAKQAAGEIRDRVPSSPEEAMRPAAGLTTALLSILIILWQQAQRSRQAEQVVARQGKKASKRAAKATSRASDAVADLDWQKRLTSLKKRWDPSRVELEKISISRR